MQMFQTYPELGKATFTVPALTVVTWNPADKSSAVNLTGSNLTATKGGSNAYGSVRATASKQVGTGIHYFEVLIVEGGTSPFITVGVSTAALALTNYAGSDPGSWSYYQDTGTKVNNASGTAYGASYTNTNVIGAEFDSDARTIEFFKNNVSQGIAFSGLWGSLFPVVSLYRGSAPFHQVVGRFKAADFSYWPRLSGANAWGI